MKITDGPIFVEQVFNTTKENLWSAITILDRMKKWFFDNISSFEAVVGFETQFVIEVEGRVFPHLWKLTDVVPNNKITYDWRYGGYPGSSIVDFEIIEEGKQTKLRLTATVVENYPDAIPEFKRESGVEGWNYFIKNSLKEYIENE